MTTSPPATNPPSSRATPPRGWSYSRIALTTLAVVAVAAAAAFAGVIPGIDPEGLPSLLRTLVGLPAGESQPADSAPPIPRPERRVDDPNRPPWDGLITVTETQQRAIGVRIVPVEPQTAPLDLEVQGKTDYNPDTLLKIRPRFDALVTAVHATTGQQVNKGDPLVELYSVSLAQAKLDYESKASQADHDKQIAMHQRDLTKAGVIPESSRVLLDALNLERRSQLEFKLARDLLEVYGVSPEELADVQTETGTEKAKMTLRAPGAGTVIIRDVVVGNIYDQNDTLMVIASIEELWVWGNVYERDLVNVQAGLPWEVQFPFSREVVHGTVDYVANQVDPLTRALRIRGSIPNADGHFKSDQLVRVFVKNPPRPGSTVIPRRSVVTEDGETFVFVQRSEAPDHFERRVVELDHEFSDRVIVAKGLAPGEQVVVIGGLVMAQIYEDQFAAETGEQL